MQLSWKVETARSCIQQVLALLNSLPEIPDQLEQPDNRKKITINLTLFVFLIEMIEGLFEETGTV